MAARRPQPSVGHHRECKSFLRDLRQFHENHGTPFRHPPRLNGREVDLYRLYVEVTVAGGWHKVNQARRWRDMLKPLGIPTECLNAGLAIKQIYLRYLDHYEMIHFHGEDPEDDMADSSDSRGRKTLTTLLPVPMTYNHHQHELSDALRVQLGVQHDSALGAMFADHHQRLVLSFLSSQPNEVDFAINVCTLLSVQGGGGLLRLDKHPRMVDLLVAQAGVFNDAIASVPGLLQGSLGVRSGKMAAFWDDTLESDEAKELLGSLRDHNDKESLGNYADLFNLSQSLGVRGREGQLVVQIATILQNLSFDECNVSVLASSPVCLKFLLLCAYNRWSHLKQLSFDTLSNLCYEMSLEPYDDLYTQLIYRTVVRNLLVDDRFLLIRGLEMLAGLCTVTSNSYVLVRAIEDKVYQRICSLLSVRDLMLLVYVLECLYRITELGSEPCTRIAQIHGVIDNLVGLVTMDAELYGPEACIDMKLVDTPEMVTLATAGTAPTANPITTTSATSVAAASSVSQPQQQQHIALSSPPKSSASFTSHSHRSMSLPIPVGYQELDNEAFACSWLKATYEICPQRGVSLASIYNDYQSACIKLAKKGLIGPTQLSNYVRSVFPHVMPRIDASDMTVEGIRRRIHPLPVSIVAPVRQPTNAASYTRSKHQSPSNMTGVGHAMTAPSLVIPITPKKTSTSPGIAVNTSHSPILKAQLSAPPRSPPPPASSSSASSSPAASTSQSPPSSPTNGGGASKESSSLIKSLLATKVSQNIQRQQQQKQHQQQRQQTPNKTGVAAAATQTPPLAAVRSGARTTTTAPTQLGVMLGHCENPSKNASPPSSSAAASLARNRPTSTKRPVLLAPKTARMNGVQRVVLVSSLAKEDQMSASGAIVQPNMTLPPPPPITKRHNSESRATPSSDSKQQVQLQNGGQQQQVSRMMAATSHASSFTAMSLDAPSIFKCLELAKTQNNAEVTLFSSVSSPVTARPPLHANKGVLADLLDGKVNKVDTLLTMNGIVDKKVAVAAADTRKPFPLDSTNVIRNINNDSGGVGSALAATATSCTLTNGAGVAVATATTTIVASPIAVVATAPNMTVTTATTFPVSTRLLSATAVVVPASSFDNILSKYPNTTFSVGCGAGDTTLRGATGVGGAAVGSGTTAVLVKQCGDTDELIGFPRVSIDQLNRLHTKPRFPRIEPKRPVMAASSSSTEDADGGSESKKIRLDDAIAALIPPTDGVVVTTATTTATVAVTRVTTDKPQQVVVSSSASLVIAPSSAVKVPSKVVGAAPAATPSQPQPATNAVSRPIAPLPPPATFKREYVCEWKNCKAAFESASAVFLHACRTHAPPGSNSLPCFWENCDQMARQRFSLMTHLQDRHCTEPALRLEAARRKEIVQSGKTSIPPPPAPPPHPGYAPNAALHAIKRHALEFQSTQDVPEETESPLTKSIRLTAALILRSLATNSPLANRCICQYESYLATVAFSEAESSRTIAHFLGLLNEDGHHADTATVGFVRA